MPHQLKWTLYSFHLLSIIAVAFGIGLVAYLSFIPDHAAYRAVVILVFFLLIAAAIIEWICFDLTNGKLSAWILGITVSLLLISTYLFVFSLFSMYGLLHTQTRSYFLSSKKAVS